MFNTKGIGAVVAVVLFISVTVIAVTGFQTWYQGFQSEKLTNVEAQSDSGGIGSRIETVTGSYLYFNYDGAATDVNYSQIKIGTVTCTPSGTLTSGVNAINLTDCDGNVSTGNLDVSLVTDNGIFQKKVKLETVLTTTVSVSTLYGTGNVSSYQKISDTAGNFTGTISNSNVFARGLKNIGDLDGDGITDLGVGTYAAGASGKGLMFVLFMNTDGTVSSSQEISDSAGNFSGILSANDYMGYSVSGLGDLDGDGVIDVAVNAIRDDSGGSDSGSFYILFMNTDGTVSSSQEIAEGVGNFTETIDANDGFSSYISNIGDLDGDGIIDLAVGAGWDDDGGAERGAVYILFMNSDGTVSSSQKISDTEGNFTETLDNTDVMGFGVNSIGDLDGDGIIDLAVSASGDDDGGTDRGALYILFMNTDGTVSSSQKISDTVGNFTETLDNTDSFGLSPTGLGDFDGDGIVDIAVGAEQDDDGGAGKGAIYILFMNTDGTVSSSEKISDTSGNFTGTLSSNDYFGSRITNMGDLDGDGLTDLAVSASWDDDGGTDRGAAYVLFMGGE